MNETPDPEASMSTIQQKRLHGVVLIIIGALFLVFNLTELRWHEMWPVVFLGLAVYFVVLFLIDRNDYGVLMPASIFLFMGSIFLYSSLQGWYHMGTLWPFFLIGPGVGFFLMYLFGKKEKGLLIPGYILSGLGVLFLLIVAEWAYLWPVALIALGLVFLFRSR
jgi:uncharacterized protein (DUF486 family)